MSRFNLGGNPKSKNQLAIVFYATENSYAVAVMVFVHLLRELGIRDDADVVVLHLPLAPVVTDKMKQMRIITRPVERLNEVKEAGYRHCLLKLRILELVEYERVVFADADAIPLKSLDYLFSVPMAGPIAAPRAYWMPQPVWTSALLVARPSLASWNRARRHFETAYHNDQYDMDIVNCEFANDIHSLPEESFCLNSEWEDTRRPGFFADPLEAYSTVSVVHFTAAGKPWHYSTAQLRVHRPHAHELFYDLWERWRSTRASLFR